MEIADAILTPLNCRRHVLPKGDQRHALGLHVVVIVVFPIVPIAHLMFLSFIVVVRPALFKSAAPAGRSDFRLQGPARSLSRLVEALLEVDPRAHALGRRVLGAPPAAPIDVAANAAEGAAAMGMGHRVTAPAAGLPSRGRRGE